MIQADHPSNRCGTQNPGNDSALWYVTNGQSVVGPVATELLLRGIASSRIPNDCMVAQPSWGTWRPIHQIREVARLGRRFSWAEGENELCPGITEDLVRRAHDAGEALHFAMHAAVTATRATAGLVHRVRGPFVGLVTSSARGPGVDAELGQVMPRVDPAYELALGGTVLVGSPSSASARDPEHAIAGRFAAASGSIRGVAMAPVFDGGTLLAMIELCRADHVFRDEDRAVLRKITSVVCSR